MLNNLWNALRRILRFEGTWELMSLSRVVVDPGSARMLTQVLQPANTIRLRPEPQAGPCNDVPALQWHGITDTGLVREHNEDSLLLLDLGGEDALFAVADGMGGHDAGEVASRIAVEAAARTVRNGRRRGDLQALVREAVEAANTAVREEAVRRNSNMGTTLTVALVHDRTAYVANVGDSRAYWIKEGSIEQITRDHSLVAKLVELGNLDEEAARTDPRSHLLLRSIGSERTVAVDTFQVPLEDGGTLLLCTDGLWGAVCDDDLQRTCREEERTEVLCARLVQRANASGGRDNITAIAARIG